MIQKKKKVEKKSEEARAERSRAEQIQNGECLFERRRLDRPTDLRVVEYPRERMHFITHAGRQADISIDPSEQSMLKKYIAYNKSYQPKT